MNSQFRISVFDCQAEQSFLSGFPEENRKEDYQHKDRSHNDELFRGHFILSGIALRYQILWAVKKTVFKKAFKYSDHFHLPFFCRIPVFTLGVISVVRQPNSLFTDLRACQRPFSTRSCRVPLNCLISSSFRDVFYSMTLSGTGLPFPPSFQHILLYQKPRRNSMKFMKTEASRASFFPQRPLCS